MSANDVEIVVKVDGKEASASFNSIANKGREAGQKVSQGFEHALGGAEKALSGLKKLEKGIGDVGEKGQSNGSILERAFSNVGNLVSQGVTSAVNGLQSALGSIGSSALGSIQGTLAALASILPLVAAGFASLAPALLLAGGAAGAAATGFVAAGIGLATLAIGFGGIGAALSAHTKQMSGAGKAVTDTAEQNYQAAKRIKDAERSLADAKMNEVDAAKAVNQARQDEITRLKELNITLRQQKASQADAAQALVEAKEKARRANIAGSDWEKANANNAVVDAQIQYDAITQKLSETTEEKKKASKVGVEGSDQVQAALKRERDAHEQTTRAIEALADAHHKSAVASAGAAGGIDLFGDAMKKLSPNAQKLVYALLDIEKRFDVIKRKVQDRLLAGFDVAVTDLADKWLPHLNDILGNTADHLNNFGKKLMGAFGDSEFIKNIERAGKEGGKVIDKMSDGIPALIDAFGRLAGHSGPVLQVIFGTIEKIFTWFDKWIKSADKSGKLDSFMKMAADTLQKVFDVGGKALKVVGKFIAIIFPESKSTGDSILDTVSNALSNISDWLDKPKNQKMIKQIAKDVGDFITALVKYAIPATIGLFATVGALIKFMGNVVRAIMRDFSTLGNFIAATWNAVSRNTASFLNWLSKSANSIGRGLYGMWDWLKQGFRDVLNWIIDRWNSLSFSFPSFLGGGSVGMPHINHFAHGGVASGLIMAGEHGRELIRAAPGSTVIPHGQTEQMMSQNGGGGNYTFAFDRTGNKVMDAIIDSLRLYVKSRGGSVQVALGRGNG